MTQERALRAFARHFDRARGADPAGDDAWSGRRRRRRATRVTRHGGSATVRGFLRHLHAMDGATDVPAPGLLGPTGHRTPPHVYSDAEIADLLRGRRPAGIPPAVCGPAATPRLFGLLACTGSADQRGARPVLRGRRPR